METTTDAADERTRVPVWHDGFESTNQNSYKESLCGKPEEDAHGRRMDGGRDGRRRQVGMRSCGSTPEWRSLARSRSVVHMVVA